MDTTNQGDVSWKSIRNMVGSTSYKQWNDKDHFFYCLNDACDELGKLNEVETSFVYMDIQYTSLTHQLTGRERLRVHSHELFAQHLDRHRWLMRMYDRERWHFCSLIIADNWLNNLHFRLIHNGIIQKHRDNCIIIPNQVFQALRSIPLNAIPNVCGELYRSTVIANFPSLGDDLEKVRELIAEINPAYKNYIDSCQNKDEVLFKQLFGSFNLTLNVLDDKQELFEKLSYVDIVFSPISLKYDCSDDVIAVIVGILKGSESISYLSDPPSTEALKEQLTYLIQYIHHIDLIFQKRTDISKKLDTRKELLENKIAKKLSLKEENPNSRIKQPESKGGHPDIVEYQKKVYEEENKKKISKAQDLIERLKNAGDNFALDQIEQEIDEW